MTYERLDLLREVISCQGNMSQSIFLNKFLFLQVGTEQIKGENMEKQIKGQRKFDRLKWGERQGERYPGHEVSVKKCWAHKPYLSYTSAVAHIINTVERSYSSSLRQHMEEKCRLQRSKEEFRRKGRYGTAGDRIAQMVPAEYKFISQMSFLFLYDSLVNFTCRYGCGAFNNVTLW